jgi:hypothetical protein
MNDRSWLGQLDQSNFNLCPPLDEQSLAYAVARLPLYLPTEYVAFLQHSNGATARFAEGEFILYPLLQPGPMTHASPPLGRTTVLEVFEALERNRPEYPLLVIGHGLFGVEEDIGFRRTDLATECADCPIYVYWHESGDCDPLASSFHELLDELAVIPKDGMYVPPWGV